MQSLKVFARESQEAVQRAPSQPIPSRSKRWPTKRAKFSNSLTYVRMLAVRPPPSMRATAAQASAATRAAKSSTYLCWGCEETTHCRADCTFLSHVCGGCKRVGHLEVV